MDRTEFSNFKWINESKVIHEGNRLIIEAPGESDFFCNNGAIAQSGITPETLYNAPFFYTEVTGDFVMRVQVSHDFQDTYDSATIMVMKDFQVWAKACFEKQLWHTQHTNPCGLSRGDPSTARATFQPAASILKRTAR